MLCRFQDTKEPPTSALFPYPAISFWSFAYTTPKTETTYYAATLNRFFAKYYNMLAPLYNNTAHAFSNMQYDFYLCFKYINVYPVLIMRYLFVTHAHGWQARVYSFPREGIFRFLKIQGKGYAGFRRYFPYGLHAPYGGGAKRGFEPKFWLLPL